MKNIFQEKWGFLRLAHVLLGLLLISQFILYFDWFSLLVGGILLTQAYFNIGCILGGSCGLEKPKNRLDHSSENTDDVTYELIER